jgi:hypothetical protein
MALLPKALRTRTPERLRDDVRLRAAAVGLGLIPPRTMHSPEDAAVLLEAARGARRVVEIGVYEGSSALALIEVLGPGSELHLIDPFGRRPDALPSGWGATEWATRRLVSRRLRGLGAAAPEVVWQCWSPFVAPGGTVVFHDARAGRPSGRGLPGPTAVVERELRDGAAPGWEIAAEADRTVAVRRALPNAS